MTEKLPKAFIAPDVLIKYMIKGDPDVDKMMDFAISGQIELIISDFVLYEVLASLEDNELDRKKIVKILKATSMVPSPKIPMTHSRKLDLRRSAGLCP